MTKSDMKLGNMRLKVHGFNQSRLIGALCDSGVRIKRFYKISPSDARIDIAKNDCEKTFAILEKLCYNYSVEAVSGAIEALRVRLSRIGLIIAVLVFSVVLGLSRGFIWHVSFFGNQKVTDNAINNALISCGIQAGKPLKTVDKNAVRNAVNSVEGVLESTVEIDGCFVRIEVIETTDYAPHTAYSDSDIVSNYDAEITRVITLSGTAKVRPGDRVFAGETLIAASRLSADGETVVPVRCGGSVYGKVTFTHSEVFAATEYIAREVGESYNVSTLSLFGLTIGKHKPRYEHYTAVTQTVDCFSGLLLPVKYSRTHVTRVEYEQVQNDPDQKAAEIRERAVSEKVIAAGGSEIETTVSTVSLGAGLYETHVFITAELPLIK